MVKGSTWSSGKAIWGATWKPEPWTGLIGESAGLQETLVEEIEEKAN